MAQHPGSFFNVRYGNANDGAQVKVGVFNAHASVSLKVQTNILRKKLGLFADGRAYNPLTNELFTWRAVVENSSVDTHSLLGELPLKLALAAAATSANGEEMSSSLTVSSGATLEASSASIPAGTPMSALLAEIAAQEGQLRNQQGNHEHIKVASNEENHPSENDNGASDAKLDE